jgi:hypothetical protein
MKTLGLLLLLMLFGCETAVETCGECYHVSIIIDSTGTVTTSDPWGHFTTCGDTLNLSGTSGIVHIDETDTDIIDVIYCK